MSLEEREKHCEEYRKQAAVAISQTNAMYQRVAQLEKMCKILHDENSVAVDYILRLDSLNDAIDDEVLIVDSSENQASNNQSVTLNPHILKQGIPDVSNVNFDSEIVSQYVDSLLKLLDEQGIKSPLKKKQADSGETIFEIVSKDNSKPQPAYLGVRNGFLVVKRDDGRYVDLLKSIITV